MGLWGMAPPPTYLGLRPDHRLPDCGRATESHAGVTTRPPERVNQEAPPALSDLAHAH